MASQTNIEACCLCSCTKYRKISHHRENGILFKIEKYLGVVVTLENVSQICLNCYQAIEDFHTFFEKVCSSQQKLKNVQLFEKSFSSVGIQTDCDIYLAQDRSFTPKPEPLDDVDVNVDNDSNDSSGKKQELSTPESLKTEKQEENNRLRQTKTALNIKKRVKSKHITKEFEQKMVEFYNVKCEECATEDLKFDSFKELNDHYLKFHKRRGYVKCCRRNIRLSDKSYLKNHMTKHLEPESCRCSICGKELSSAVTLKHHLNLHKPLEERPFHCNSCDKKFCCKNDLKNHFKTQHPSEGQRENVVCDVCGKVFRKICNLKYHHMIVHLKEKKCICEICARCFTTRTGLKSHMESAHNTNGPLKCSICNKWLKNKETLRRHAQLHQNNSYPCSMCEKVCNSGTSLRSHMVKHSEIRPFECPTCRKSFKTKTHLKNHLSQHAGANNISCPHCGKVFVNKSNFYTHRKRMHSGEYLNPKGEKLELNKRQCFDYCHLTDTRKPTTHHEYSTVNNIKKSVVPDTGNSYYLNEHIEKTMPYMENNYYSR